eukprot:8521147-Alexandrium_andersonii.AAC.1
MPLRTHYLNSIQQYSHEPNACSCTAPHSLLVCVRMHPPIAMGGSSRAERQNDSKPSARLHHPGSMMTLLYLLRLNAGRGNSATRRIAH